MKRIIPLFLCVHYLYPMDPYAFPEKEQFPEHNNFFMPTTNDLSYVPRNIGKIGIENDLSYVKKQTDALQADLKNENNARIGMNAYHQDEVAYDELMRVFEDQELMQQTITLTVKELSLPQILQIIASKTGLIIHADQSAMVIVKNIQVQQMPVGTLLKILCLHAEPPLGVVKDGSVYRVMSQEKALAYLKKRKILQRQTVVIPIKHARVDDNFAKKIKDSWDKINILHDDRSSYMHIDLDEKKVFARGLPNQMEELKSYLQEVDEPIVQIRIDVILIIAEKNFNLDFGFDWSGIYNRQQTITATKPPFAFYGLGGTLMDYPTPDKPVVNPPNRQESTNIFVDPFNFALNLFNSGLTFLNPDRATQNVAGAIRLPFIFGGPDLSVARLNVVLNAAEIDSKLKIVSRPSVLTSNNEVAKLLIGSSIPLQTTIEDLSTNSTRNITTINFKDVGTMIEVKPTVSPDKKAIFLDILIEDSAVTAGTTKTNAQGILVDPPTISMVKVKNRVQLRNSQTTIIGGLSFQAATEARNMVPWFWKIPILGYLFQATFSSNKDQERYIFLTPTIIEEI